MTQTLDFISLVPWTMIVMIINLYILYRIVRRFLFKPVQDIFKQREEELHTLYSDANTNKQAAEKAKEAYEQKLQDVSIETEKILLEAKKSAQAEQKEIRKQAQEQAHKIIQRAQDNVLQIQKKAQAEIQKESADMAVDIASILLEREIDKSDQEQLIVQYLKQIKEDEAI